MDYKQSIQEAYDRYAKQFEINTSPLFEDVKIRDAESFIKSLKGKRILDLGSGPGVHSLYFKQQGLSPICLDLSMEMAKLCKEKGLEVVIGDLEHLPFTDSAFDGVWAYTSLLHIPKVDLPLVLKNIKSILTSQGIFCISMKEGDFEGEVTSDKYPGVKRFFALYNDEELRKLLEDWQIFHHSRKAVGNARFLNYLCMVK